jgi:Haloacid dehalogenase-like hydrolase
VGRQLLLLGGHLQEPLVYRGKPNLEVYLLATARVGVSPERCIVVEDAGVGIEGARRAGTRSIGITHNDKDLQGDVVVESLDLLEPDVFERLLNHRESGDPQCSLSANHSSPLRSINSAAKTIPVVS